jgi:hypothetical protein
VGKAVEASAIYIRFNNDDPYYVNQHLVETLRPGIETEVYESTQNGFTTTVVYDIKTSSVENALYSIYTTIFVLFLLLVGCSVYYLLIRGLILVVGLPVVHILFLQRRSQFSYTSH